MLGRGPMGAGMPETAQITSALKYTKALSENALITDGRFSGFSSGPCIGHIGPEALSGGPIGKLRDGDQIKIEINKDHCVGEINYIGDVEAFQKRPMNPNLREDLIYRISKVVGSFKIQEAVLGEVAFQTLER